MAQVYKVVSNLNDYKMFVVDDLDIYEKMEDFSIDEFGQKLSFKWVAPNCNFIESDSGDGELPDVTQWSTNDLVISKKALEALDKLLGDSYCQTLPLKCDPADYVFINPLARLENDTVDTEKSKVSYFDDGAWDRVTKLVLKKSATKKLPPIFTLDYDGGVNLYCSEEFKAAVVSNRLQGLSFEAVETA